MVKSKSIVIVLVLFLDHLVVLGLSDFLEYLPGADSSEFLIIEAIRVLLGGVREELMNDVGVALVAPEGEICEGHRQHVLRMLLVVLRHMPLYVPRAQDLPTFQAEPDLSLMSTACTRRGYFDSLI